MFKSVSDTTKGLSIILISFFLFFGNISLLYAQEFASITTTVSISICGNSVVEGGEICDVKNLNTLSCKDFGYEYGELKCCISCDEYDLSNCFNSFEEIELEREFVSQEEVVEEDLIGHEETVAKGDIINFDDDSAESLLLTEDNALNINVILEENDLSEIMYPEFEEVSLLQDITSRSPP